MENEEDFEKELSVLRQNPLIEHKLSGGKYENNRI
jgi:hypothetical protein